VLTLIKYWPDLYRISTIKSIFGLFILRSAKALRTTDLILYWESGSFFIIRIRCSSPSFPNLTCCFILIYVTIVSAITFLFIAELSKSLLNIGKANFALFSPKRLSVYILAAFTFQKFDFNPSIICGITT